MDTRPKVTGWLTINKFDGNYTSWAYNMNMLLHCERCKGIVGRTEVPPAGATTAGAVELDLNGKPIPVTGSAGAAARQAITDHTFRVWEALRLISQSLEQSIE
jgi:hypothetical protein